MVTAEWWERLQKKPYRSEFQGHVLINYVFQHFLLNRAQPSYFYHCRCVTDLALRNSYMKLLMQLKVRAPLEHVRSAPIALCGLKNAFQNFK